MLYHRLFFRGEIVGNERVAARLDHFYIAAEHCIGRADRARRYPTTMAD
ncbi:MAG: hypothetical protein WAL85_09750 [Candidatus Korobacteraceae bacterium]